MLLPTLSFLICLELAKLFLLDDNHSRIIIRVFLIIIIIYFFSEIQLNFLKEDQMWSD